MAGASIEATLEVWASSLQDVKGRIRPLFARDSTARNAGLFLDGLLGEERRKTAGCARKRRATHGDLELVLEPLHQVHDPPAHHAVDRGRRPGLDRRRQRRPMLRARC